MPRQPFVIVLDTLAVCLAALAVIILNYGGFVVRIAGIRVSAQTPTRALVGLGVVLLLRRLFFRRTDLLGVSSEKWRRALVLPGGALFQSQPLPGGRRRAAAASAGLAVALAVLLHAQVLQPYSVPDLGDPLFSIWRMGWVVHALLTEPTRLFDANIFHPLPLTLTLSDSIVLPALVGAPLRALGLHPVVVYNLVMFWAFWLSGVATYLLVERLTESSRAAFIAGLLYATAAFRFDHYSHLELQMTQWMPLALLALHLLVVTRRWPYAVALSLAGVAQLYSGMYYAVFFVAYVAVIGGGVLLAHRPPIRPLLLPMVGAAILAGAFAAPMVRAYNAAEPIKGERGVPEILAYSATPVDYLRANRYSAVWGDRLLQGIPERALFPGAAPVALGAMGLIPPLGAMQLVYAAGLFISVDGSFGLHGLVYPQLYRWFSPFRGLRSPARFGAIVALTLAILSGFGARRVLRRCSPRSGQVVFGLMIAAAMIDAWPRIPLTPVWRQPPPVYQQLQGKNDVVLAEFPVVAGDAAFNTAYMYFSTWHWRPMVNGYSGFIPRPYNLIAPDLWAFPSAGSLAVLRSRGVTHVTMNCGLRYVRIEVCEAGIDQLQGMPGVRLIADDQWASERVALFEVRPAP